MSKAIMRIAKRKDIGSIRRCAAHHLRAAPTPNADPAREFRVLAGESDHLVVTQKVRERVKPLMLRKDAIQGMDVFCGTSPDFFKNGGSKEDFEKHTMAWANKTFGKENIVLAVLHDDETTMHIQMLVTPITPKGKLSASHWLDGPKKLSALQDSFAEEMKPLGLERGVKGSKSTHESIKSYYARIAAHEAEMQAEKEAIKTASAELALKTHQNTLQAKKIEESRLIILENDKRLKSRSAKLDVRETTLEKLSDEIQRQKEELMRVIHRVPANIKAMIRDVFNMKKPDVVTAENDGEKSVSPSSSKRDIKPI